MSQNWHCNQWSAVAWTCRSLNSSNVFFDVMRSWRTSAELQLVRHVHSLHSTSIVLSLPSFLFGGPALHTQTLYHHKIQNIYIILMHQPSINIILDIVAVRTAVSLDPSSRLRWSSNQRIPTYKMEQLRWAEGTPKKNNLWTGWSVDTSQHYEVNIQKL